MSLYNYNEGIGNFLNEIPQIDIQNIIAIIGYYAIPTFDDMIMATSQEM